MGLALALLFLRIGTGLAVLRLLVYERLVLIGLLIVRVAVLVLALSSLFFEAAAHCVLSNELN